MSSDVIFGGDYRGGATLLGPAKERWAPAVEGTKVRKGKEGGKSSLAQVTQVTVAIGCVNAQLVAGENSEFLIRPATGRDATRWTY